MEHIREVKIKIYVDTNKATYDKTFDNIKEAAQYLVDIMENING